MNHIDSYVQTHDFGIYMYMFAMHIFMYTCYVYICVCLYACTYIYVYMYIHRSLLPVVVRMHKQIPFTAKNTH